MGRGVSQPCSLVEVRGQFAGVDPLPPITQVPEILMRSWSALSTLFLRQGLLLDLELVVSERPEIQGTLVHLPDP